MDQNFFPHKQRFPTTVQLFSPKKKPKTDFHGSIRNQTDVALTLTKHILTSELMKEQNLVWSPITIQVLLSLAAAGSKGPTLDQLVSFLKSKSSDKLTSFSSEILSSVFSGSEGPTLSFANSVWVDKSLAFKKSFKQVADTAYKALASQVDFQNKADEARKEVNAWVKEATNGLVGDLLPQGSVANATRLILANALYFKGDWNQKFDSSATKEHDFYLLNGSSVRVPFMTSNKRQYISAFDDFKVLGLPYNQGQDERIFSMYIFLPNAKDGLTDFVEKLSGGSEFLDRHLPRVRALVGEFRIPKFKISFDFKASQTLKESGLLLPFTPGGFTEVVDSDEEGGNLFISEIFHKSFIDVNEEGTEAAAASAMVLCGSSRYPTKPKTIDFVADHPFLFMIREDVSGVVLFIGRVLEPQSENK